MNESGAPVPICQFSESSVPEQAQAGQKANQFKKLYAALFALLLAGTFANAGELHFDTASAPSGMVTVSWANFEGNLCVNNANCAVNNVITIPVGVVSFNGYWMSGTDAALNSKAVYVVDPGTTHIRSRVTVTTQGGATANCSSGCTNISGSFATDTPLDLGSVPLGSITSPATGTLQDLTSLFSIPPALVIQVGAPLITKPGDVNWTVTNGVFQDGGTLTGSFVYSPGLETMKSWSLSVAGGMTDPFSAFTYTPLSSSFSILNGDLVFHFGDDGMGHFIRELRIGPFDSPLLTSGGNVQLVPDGSGNRECNICGSYTRTLTGGLSGTPVGGAPVLGATGTSPNPAGGTTTTVNQTTAQAVNTANGNTYVTFSDLIVPGKGLRFGFVRSYNGLDPDSGPFGTGWTHSYNILLKVDTSGAVTIKEGDGHQNVFQPGTGGAYTAPAGVYDTLALAGQNTWALTRPNQTVLAFGPISPTSSIIRLLSITDKNANVQTLSYDVLGNLVSFVDVGGGTFTFAYDGANHMTSMKDMALNHTYAYSTATSLSSYTDSNGKQSQYTYSNNLLTVATDAVTNTAVNNTFDGQGRVTQTMRGTGCAPTMYTYDDVNHITMIKDPLGHITTHYYDTKQRLIKIVNALNFTTTFTYDSNNNLLSTTNPLGKTTSYTYDTHGNRTSVTDPLGNVTRFLYDAKNNLTKQTDANLNASNFAYDTKGNLITVTDALNGVTSFTYDGHGNKLTFVNARSKTTTNTYDVGNHLLATQDPALNTTTSTYDGGGRLVSVAEPAGNSKTLAYDSLSRLTSTTYAPASTHGVTYTYDANGNRLTMTDGTGTTAYVYDTVNRPTSVTFPDGRVVSYTYDCNDNRLSIAYPGKTISYAYDALNRLTTVTDTTTATSISKITQYKYDAANNPISITYPNGAAVAYTYDAANRITQVRNTYTGSTGNPVSSFTYLLDKVGNRTQVTDGSGKVTTFAYDKLYRMTGTVVTQKASGYTYDAVGNRVTQNAPSLSMTYTYDFADKLQTAGSTTFHYDANGNQLSNGNITYGYDAADRLVSVSGGTGPASSFVYDGDGNRVSQKVGTAMPYTYLNDIVTGFATVLDETGPDGHIQYVRGRSLISADGPASTLYYHYDAQSTVAGVTDTTGHLAERYVYDVWGEQTLPVPNPGIGTQNKFGYTGEALDPGTSLYYLRSRYYDPALGRFINKDSFLGFDRTPQSLNRFTYVRNNPATLTDRTGFCDDDDDFFFFWPCAPPLP